MVGKNGILLLRCIVVIWFMSFCTPSIIYLNIAKNKNTTWIHRCMYILGNYSIITNVASKQFMETELKLNNIFKQNYVVYYETLFYSQFY